MRHVSGGFEAERGFTLVEIMVVIVIIAVIGAMAAPSFRDLINTSRISSATNEVVIGLQSARMEAIRTNSRGIFCRATAAAPTVCNGSDGAWTNWVVGIDNNSDNVIDTVTSQGRFATQLTVRNSSNIADSTVVFRPDSFARASNGSLLGGGIQVCLAGRHPTTNARLVRIGSGSRVSTEQVTDLNCSTTVSN